MRGAVSVEIAGILKAQEENIMFAGASVDAIAVRQADRHLAVRR
jgi:hypothetical protein